MVTTIAPAASASFCPSYVVSAPLPRVKPPPWIHSITGTAFFAAAAGAHTLSVRQSSLVPAIGVGEVGSSCGQYGVRFDASIGCVHDAAGSGGFQRIGPTGGAA